jgi:hypothetical protein
MPPSALPGGHRPSSFCSVDWLSQSSCSGPRQGSSNKNPSQMDIQKDKLSELVVGQTPVAGKSGEGGWGSPALPRQGWMLGGVQEPGRLPVS